MTGLVAPALQGYLCFGLLGDGTPAPIAYFETDLIAYLNGMGIAATPGHIPEKATLPAVSFLLTTGESAMKLSGVAGICEATYLFTCSSKGAASCLRLAEQLRRALVVVINRQLGGTYVYSITAEQPLGMYEDEVGGGDKGAHSHARQYDVMYDEFVP